MYTMIFDTETTSLDKPFCYNVGYVIWDTDTDTILERKDFVCREVWHNPMLFTTAYYANKRDLYVSRMRGKKALLRKFGTVCEEMIEDIKNYGIEYAYAYNSPFDDGVFSFNCDWFKCNNPFDDVKILDIRGFAHKEICQRDDYKEYCERYERFTESGNYSTTAETVYQYLWNEPTFEEEHTALADSEIEQFILGVCMRGGLDITEDIKPLRTIYRKKKKTLTVKAKNETLLEVECESYRVMKSKDTIIIK